MNFLRQKMRDPKVQVSILLLILFAMTFRHLPFATGSSLLLACVSFTIAFDLLFTFIRKRRVFLPHAAMVTGTIITLIIDPSASLMQILVITSAAMAIKNFLRVSGRHIFNPAASGLLVGWIVFSLSPSWWGPSFYTGGLLSIQNLFILAPILSIFLVSGLRMRRFIVTVTFLVVFPALFGLATNSLSMSSFLRTILAPGTLFYAIVMLPEPMTTPVLPNRQVMYGVCVAVLNAFFASGIQTRFIGNTSLFDTSLLALLVSNLLFFKFR